MSEHTSQDRSTGRNRREAPSPSGNGADQNTAETAGSKAAVGNALPAISATMSAEIKTDKDTVVATVDLARKWQAGMVNTEHSALIIDTSNLRQFCNNMNANAKARAERFAKAKTDADKAANAPLTADDYVALWLAYEGPAIGDMQRMSSIETLRITAAWKVWVAMVAEHNEAAKTGGSPVIVKAVKDGKAVPVELMAARRLQKGATAEQKAAHELELESFEASKLAFLQKLLTSTVYADRIQTQIDLMVAERDAAKAKTVDANAIKADGDLI